MNRIAQRSPETFESNLHYISILQADASPETQAIGSEIMNMDIPGPAMSFKLKVVMFKIL
jgi:hypothetical protein